MRRVLVVLALIALSLGLGVVSAGAESATSSSSAVPSAGAGAKVLRVGWENSPDSLNPFVGTQTEAYTLYHLNYDFLVQYDSATLKPIPGLAESWSNSTDGTTWTFKLRHDVKWQDGVAFTSKDVVFTFKYIIDNELGSYTGYTKGITDVVAKDDYTVVFTTDKPKATMLQMWVPILPEHIWSKISPKDAGNKFENKPPVIGTGPFQIVSWKRGSWVRMKANPGYWGGAPKVDEVIFSVYTNPDTLVSDLESGLLQFGSVTQAGSAKLQTVPGLTAILAQYQAFDDVGFNCYDQGPSRGHPAMRDPAFRQALSWAIDKEAIAAIGYGGAAVPATSILPSNYWPKDADYHWQPPADGAYSYDVAKAKQLLDEAGYKDANGDGVRDYRGQPIKLRLWASNERPELGLAGKLVAGYLQAVGLKVVYQVMDSGAMNDGVYATKDGELDPDYDMFVWGWAGDYDPGFLLSVLTSSQINSWSDTGWSNKDYDDLYEEQDGELDDAKRVDLVHQMEQIVYQDCPYIPTVYRQSREVYDSADWEGWVKMPAETGGVDNRWTYMNVQPKTGSTAAGSSSSTGWIAAVIVAVVVVALLIVWRVRARRVAIVEAD